MSDTDRQDQDEWTDLGTTCVQCDSTKTEAQVDKGEGGRVSIRTIKCSACGHTEELG